MIKEHEIHACHYNGDEMAKFACYKDSILVCVLHDIYSISMTNEKLMSHGFTHIEPFTGVVWEDCVADMSIYIGKDIIHKTSADHTTKTYVKDSKVTIVNGIRIRLSDNTISDYLKPDLIKDLISLDIEKIKRRKYIMRLDSERRKMEYEAATFREAWSCRDLDDYNAKNPH